MTEDFREVNILGAGVCPSCRSSTLSEQQQEGVLRDNQVRPKVQSEESANSHPVELLAHVDGGTSPLSDLQAQ